MSVSRSNSIKIPANNIVPIWKEGEAKNMLYEVGSMLTANAAKMSAHVKFFESLYMIDEKITTTSKKITKALIRGTFGS